ncbi:hypothetical protein [Corallococcus sp. AB038B]|uniref:hypothetical protein n=1 Tax=Corallococcus sp. AB038B TaxID=2316718 RepID=UPI000EBB53D2|nr:hypothetical protein [Corallococcus sp. AB038B]RKI05240.1 hypothetical protein D7Y04_10395 [Corallococcus sp. AB038B]
MRHLLLLLTVTFIACSSDPSSGPDAGEPDSGVICGPGNCAGCCDAAGQCRDGMEHTACGMAGAACNDCLTAACVTGGCETPVESVGDTCATPYTLALDEGNATLQGDLRRYAPNRLGCVAGSRDAVYAFTLAAPAEVDLSVVSRTPGFEPVLRVGNTCARPDCNASGLERSRFEGVLAPGTYFVVVSTRTLTAGEFDLALGTRPPPSGERCSEAALLPFDSHRQATFQVPTEGRADDFTLDCMAWSPGPDSVYRFRVDQPSDFTATLSDGVIWGGSMLALRSACDGVDLGCGPALSVADLAPGEYLLFADSAFDGTSSPLTVTAQLTGARPQGETCGRAVPITLSGGTAHLTDTLRGATNDVPERCSDSINAPDRIYSFTLDQPMLVNATATRLGTSGALSVRVQEARYCGTSFSTGCQWGATSATVQELLPAGTYVLVVESATGIDYTLDVSAVPPPEGESCANPVGFDLPAGGGTLTHQASTRGSSQENYVYECLGANLLDLPDRVYSLTLTDPHSNLVVTATATGANNEAPALLLVTDCLGTTPVVQNCESTVQASRVLRKTALPAGTYFLWVKSPNEAGTDYRLDVSATPTPEGDTCAVATPVTLSGGPAGGFATLTGTTVGMSDDLRDCDPASTASFPEHVYSLTLDRELDVKVKMTPAQASARGMVSLADAACQVSQNVCGQPGADGVTTLRAGSLKAGTHFFSVDHPSGGPDAYSLEFSATPHQPGETCANPRPLVFSEGGAGGTAVLAFDARDFFDEPFSDCSVDGADAYFTFTTDRVLDLYVDVSHDESKGAPLLSLIRTCGERLSCQPVSLTTGPFGRGSLQPGTYILAVDFMFAQSERPVTIQALLTPPTPGDTCALALPLGLPPEGGTTVLSGTFTGAFDNHQGECTYSGLSGADRVYTFTTSVPMSFIAEATAGTRAPTLTLRRGTCDGPEASCAVGGLARASIRDANLAAGTYYLFVDRAYEETTDYSLKVSLGSIPAGDVCANALPLGLPTSGPGQVTVQGDTGRFFHDLTPSCGEPYERRAAPDTVYTFTTTEPMNLRLSTKALTPGFRPTVALRRACGGTETDLRCAATPYNSPDTWTSYRDLPAGTYYVVVDGFSTAYVGDFELVARLSRLDHAEPGESCANPEPLTLSQGGYGRATLTRVFGDFPDHEGCGRSDGSDAVFAVTTDRPRRLHARVSGSQAETQPALSVRRGPCDDTASQLACMLAQNGHSRVSTDLPAGTSYLLVKSGLLTPAGTFQLDVEVDDFGPGDLCAGALPLAFSNGAAGGTATATFNPATHGSDATLTCDSGSRPDTFFTFTTDRVLNLSATLLRPSYYTGEPFSMGLLAGCGGPELACRGPDSSLGPLVLTRSALPAGTHVLVVRGALGATLNLTLNP